MRFSLVVASCALSGFAVGAHADVHEKEKFTRVRNARDLRSSYDYIVVGGGTSGLTVADRLSEDGKTSVLVIEHGDLVNSSLIDNVSTGKQAMSGEFLYPLSSVPQTSMRNQLAVVLAGKVVGGSSAVNTMMTVRGTVEDYDRWQSYWTVSSATPSSTVVSNPTWGWVDLLPYFKKALHFAPPVPEVAASSNITYDASFWGNTSSVYASWPTYQFPGTKLLVDAFRQIPGVEFPPDSGAGKTGVYWFPTFMDPRSVNRSYARTGHYDNVRRENCQLLPSTKVLKVLMNDTTAVGVTFLGMQNGSVITTVRAGREVIIAAGGIHSPQVLQRSGIGPKKLLASANITTIVELPGVGQNFQDHHWVALNVNLRNWTISPALTDLTDNATFRAWANAVWAANRTGPNSIAISNAAAWLPMPVVSPGRFAELAALVAEQDPAALLPAGTDPTVVAGYKAQLKAMSASMVGKGTTFLNAVLKGGPIAGALFNMHPLSRGTISIDPSDPFGKEPLVDYRAMTNPADALIMAEMVRFMRRYWFNTTNAALGPVESTPGSRIQTDEDIRNWLAETLTPTEYHPAGGCSMLPLSLGGVVDQRLRVYGTKGLRVVDASIMPTLPGANTCQTVYAVAERAADLIKEDAMALL